MCPLHELLTPLHSFKIYAHKMRTRNKIYKQRNSSCPRNYSRSDIAYWISGKACGKHLNKKMSENKKGHWQLNVLTSSKWPRSHNQISKCKDEIIKHLLINSIKKTWSPVMITYFWRSECLSLGSSNNCVRRARQIFFFVEKHQISFEKVSMVGAIHVNPIPMISVETFAHWFLSSKTIYC